MNYQAIRAKIEGPLLSAFNSQTPPIPVYFDNITFVPPDPPKEYVRVNLTFGVTTESALARSWDYPRGALIIRCFSEKGYGPARCQKMLEVAKGVIDEINLSKKTSSGVYVRTSEIKGPFFQTLDDYSHFMGRLDTGWQASVK